MQLSGWNGSRWFCIFQEEVRTGPVKVIYTTDEVTPSLNQGKSRRNEAATILDAFHGKENVGFYWLPTLPLQKKVLSFELQAGSSNLQAISHYPQTEHQDESSYRGGRCVRCNSLKSHRSFSCRMSESLASAARSPEGTAKCTPSLEQLAPSRASASSIQQSLKSGQNPTLLAEN